MGNIERTRYVVAEYLNGGAAPTDWHFKRADRLLKDVDLVPRSQLEGAVSTLQDICAIGVGTVSARDDALEMQRLAGIALDRLRAGQ
jgi:hypothetical protein